MIDITYVRKNPETVKKNIIDRGLDPDIYNVDELLRLDTQRVDMLREVEKLREERNKMADKMRSERSEELIEQGRAVKETLRVKEEALEKIGQDYQNLMDMLPNLMSPDMPRGKSSADNMLIKEWGNKPQFNFQPKNHLELGEELDLIDTKVSANVSGSRFYYLKNEAVMLQFGLFNLALQKLVKRGFIPITVPVLLKRRALYGTGYFPSEESQVYKLETNEKLEEKDDLYLAGTSEQAIVSYHADTVLPLRELPKKYVGYSTCFRSEVGSWGKDVYGIKRVHQFDKIEMIYFTTPETSEQHMREALAIEEELLQELGLSYHVIDMCSGDVGMATYRKFDTEVWLPGQQEYCETMSDSDLDAFHARRLNIRYQKEDGEREHVHTVSATAITNTRPIIAILENYQQEDGSVRVPEVLREYVGTDVIRKKP